MKQDSLKLEKFLQAESSLERREKKCQRHREHCVDCQLLSQSNNLKETNLIRAIWNNIESIKQKDYTYLIRHNYIYRNDSKELYAPGKTNILATKCHSKKIILKCERKGQLLQELSDEEVSNLKSKIHHFSFFHWVENPNSSSTPFRLISTQATHIVKLQCPSIK